MGLLLCAYVVGIALSPALPYHPLLPAAPLVLAALCWWRHQRAGAALLVPAFVLCTGIVLGQLQLLPPAQEQDVSHYANSAEPVVLLADIAGVELLPETGMTLVVEARQIGLNAAAKPVSGRVRLSVREGQNSLRAGDVILCRTRLHPPRKFQTPGEFDTPRHLAGRGIFTTGFIPRSDEIVLLGSSADRLQLWIQQRRHDVGLFIDSQVAPPWAALVKALSIGTQSDIDPRLRRTLTDGGVWHLFAISGSHLTLVAGLLIVVGSGFWKRSEILTLWSPPSRIVPLLALPLLYAFHLWTGEGTSMLRALLMFALIAVLFACSRYTSAWHILMAAVWAILLSSPLTLFEPGFQLSAAGVAGIVLLLRQYSPQLEPLPRLLRFAGILFLSTVGATLATLPLVLLHFRLFAPAGLLTNFIAVPLVGLLVVPLALLAALLSGMAPMPAAALFNGCAVLLEQLTHLVEAIVSWPPLAGRILFLTPLEIIAVAMLVVVLIVPWPQRWDLHRCAMGLSAVALLALSPLPPPAPSLTMLSVGQGEAMLLTLSNGEHYLIDGGGLFSSSFDTGERLVAPALARLGVKRLKGVIMSHSHPDHSAGLTYILNTLPTDSFWQASDEELPEAVLRAVTAHAIPRRLAPPGWSQLPATGADRITLFHPCVAGASANDHSLVLRAEFSHEQTLLLAGDIESAGVRELQAHTPRFAPALLKLPHHGSRHSAPGSLFDSFPAQLAIVSVGHDNRFGFPHQTTLTALQERAIPLWRTDRDGTLRVRPQGRGWIVECWNNGDFR